MLDVNAYILHTPKHTLYTTGDSVDSLLFLFGVVIGTQVTNNEVIT